MYASTSGEEYSFVKKWGIKGDADNQFVQAEAYSHEVSSCGFWPGGGLINEPAFYAYAYPEPQGFKEYPIQPPEAFYHIGMGEFLLPYAVVRTCRVT